mgnify:CR=1 FL=1
MSAELLINVTPSETRVALIENGVLQEVHIERQAKHGLVGNIYMGKISRVLPGMQAAFVDIGLDKAAFLHASDIVTAGLNIADAELKAGPVKDIRLLVHEGQFLLVQIYRLLSCQVLILVWVFSIMKNLVQRISILETPICPLKNTIKQLNISNCVKNTTEMMPWPCATSVRHTSN